MQPLPNTTLLLMYYITCHMSQVQIANLTTYLKAHQQLQTYDIKNLKCYPGCPKMVMLKQNKLITLGGLPPENLQKFDFGIFAVKDTVIPLLFRFQIAFAIFLLVLLL